MICKTPKNIFASTSTIPEPFFLDMNTSFRYGQATLLCNEWDATISKVLQAIRQSKNIMHKIQLLALVKKREIQTETQRVAEATYRLNRTLASWRFSKSSEIPAINSPLLLNVPTCRRNLSAGGGHARECLHVRWAMACPKKKKKA